MNYANQTGWSSLGAGYANQTGAATTTPAPMPACTTAATTTAPAPTQPIVIASNTPIDCCPDNGGWKGSKWGAKYMSQFQDLEQSVSGFFANSFHKWGHDNNNQGSTVCGATTAPMPPTLPITPSAPTCGVKCGVVQMGTNGSTLPSCSVAMPMTAGTTATTTTCAASVKPVATTQPMRMMPKRKSFFDWLIGK